jgi:uncharacterized protein (TIGR04255 family)
MHFPDSERVTFATDTLVEVICQLRFPQILAVGTRSPDEFQELVRADYPIYRKQQAPVGLPPDLPAELSQIVGQLAWISGPEAVTHWFASQDENLAISLGTNFVAVTAKRYPGWHDLRPVIVGAIDALDQAYAPAFYERVGLRYRDEINREEIGLEAREWAELLNPEIISLLGANLGITPGHDRIVTSALLHLDDPEEAFVHLTHGVGETSQHTYQIDADFYIERQPIERDAAFVLLDRFNHEEGNLFRWAIGSELRRALGERPAV